jgi:anti-sigma factor ChrR (cupin superfamily)
LTACRSQARLSALFSSLATFYDSYTHPRVSDADLGAAIDQCLAVAQAADAHWRYRMLASVVLMMYTRCRDRVGAERARRGALCEQRRRSAAAAARDRAVGDRVAAAALQATFDDRRRACVAQRR